MARFFYVLPILILFLGFNAMAGMVPGTCSSRCERDAGTVAAAIQLADQGVYNLFVSVRFLRKPYEKMVYNSEDYRYLMDRVMVGWRGVALKVILESKALAVTDLIGLKNDIETEIERFVDREKEKTFPGKNVAVVFSLSDFFVMEPKEK